MLKRIESVSPNSTFCMRFSYEGIFMLKRIESVPPPHTHSEFVVNSVNLVVGKFESPYKKKCTVNPSFNIIREENWGGNN